MISEMRASLGRHLRRPFARLSRGSRASCRGVSFGGRTVLLTLAMVGLVARALPAAHARADEPSGEARAAALIEPSDRTSVSAEAQRALADAVVEHEAGRYEEALALLHRAHGIEPTARTSRAIAMAAFELRRYVLTVRALREALASAERPLTQAQRAHAEALLVRASGFVAHVRVQLEPLDAELRVDGELAVHEVDGTLMLEAGRHVLGAAHAEREPLVLEVVLEAGRTADVVLRLERIEAPPDPARPGDAGDEVAEENALRTVVAPPIAASRDAVSPWFVSSAAIGGLAVLATSAAIASGLFALSNRDLLADACDPFFCPDALRPVREQARTLSVVADGLGVAAATLGAVSVLLLAVGAAIDDAPAPRASLACGASGCAALVSGSF